MSEGSHIQRVKIGKRIADERDEAGYTQAELARAIGIDPTTLSRIERGERGLDSLVLRRLSRELQVSMESILDPSATELSALARANDSSATREMLAWARKAQADIRFVRREAALLDGP